MAESNTAKMDPESKAGPYNIPHWRMLVDQQILTPDVENETYEGSGTEDDPYLVSWLENDARNPMQWRSAYKWMVTLSMAGATLAVSLASSAFSPGIPFLMREFGSSQIVATLTLSLFVLGFAVGPLLWAPFSELYGRQYLFIGTFGAFVAFNAGVCGCQNMAAVIVTRFFAGAFGSSPLTNAGGVIADMFPAKDRGVAIALFAAAPFLGPSIGPVIGGFLGQAAGWRWLAGFIAAFSGLVWFIGIALTPETYAPVLLRKRAKALSKKTGKVYLSSFDAQRGVTSVGEAFKSALLRPWILLFREPIVMILSIYMAIIYGTLYMLFAAYPIVYQQGRGWSPGIGGLAFIGVLIGMIGAVTYSIYPENPRYQKIAAEHKGFAPPEARLPPSIIGGICLPVGLFWFAWTNSPNLPWAASMAAGIPFGFGMVLVFLCVFSYLVDSYSIFAASVLAANSVLRSSFGAAFPLFTSYMYDGLGIHWASSIPAFLALACVPFPILFYKYGAQIRLKSKYAAESDAFMKKIQAASEKKPAASAAASVSDVEKEEEFEKEHPKEEAEEPIANRFSTDSEDGGRFQRIRTGQAPPPVPTSYEEGPFDIDRVNTRESFSNAGRRNSRSNSVSSGRGLGLTKTLTGRSGRSKSGSRK